MGSWYGWGFPSIFSCISHDALFIISYHSLYHDIDWIHYCWSNAWLVVYWMLNDTQVVTQMSFTPEHKHCWFSGRILACHAGDRGSIPRQCTGLGDIFKFIRRWNQQTLRVGFEPTREDPIWFLVKRLNHSAIAARDCGHTFYWSWFQKHLEQILKDKWSGIYHMYTIYILSQYRHFEG